MTEATPYRCNHEPITRATFDAIACNPQQSVVIEACAGSGKTWMLVSRMLRALLDGAAPQEILAITFTRKAAGEMRERLNTWLRDYAAPSCTHADRTAALLARGLSADQAEQLAPQLEHLYERILSTGRAVEICTIHAWFSQLLRGAPLDVLLELGLQRDVELLENPADHVETVFHAFYAQLLQNDALRADFEALIALRGRHAVREWLQHAWSRQMEFEQADQACVLERSVPAPAAFKGQDPAATLMHEHWQEELANLAKALGRGGAAARKAAVALQEALEVSDARLHHEHIWQALFTDKGTPRKLGAVEGLAEAQDALLELAAHVQQHNAHLEHMRMVRLTRVLLAEWAAYKRAQGLADMADLERCAVALLRDTALSGWMQERLDVRLRHVLIDEFQDTSPLQWQALHAWLSSYAGAGGGASGHKPPSLLIVGDPKQSIYRFRGAEPKVFAAARDFVMQALGGQMLSCDHTRRNAPAVLKVLNAVFAPAEHPEETPDEGSILHGFRPHTTEQSESQGTVQYLPRVLRPPKKSASGQDEEWAWRDTLATPRYAAETVLREQEAELVAQAIEVLITTEGIAPGDIHVLCRKRQSLELVAQALTQRNLPFAAAHELSVMASPEARDLIALLDVLTMPSHHLSLVQVLRSPAFGFSDDDLIALARRRLVGDLVGASPEQVQVNSQESTLPKPAMSWWAALMAFAAEPEAAPQMQRAATLLSRWRDLSRTLPPHDLLDHIVAESDWHERVASTLPAHRRREALQAVDAVLQHSLTLDGARYATPYTLVRALKERHLIIPTPAQADAVQLLTIHGAKGLEAKVVLVMDTDPEPNKAETTTLLIHWPDPSGPPEACAFIYSESQCPPSLQGVLDEEKQARAREELNSLYVAMTRARERLIVSATEPFRARSEASWWARVYVQAALWEVAEAGFTQQRS